MHNIGLEWRDPRVQVKNHPNLNFKMVNWLGKVKVNTWPNLSIPYGQILGRGSWGGGHYPIILVSSSFTTCDHQRTGTLCWKERKTKSGFPLSLLPTLLRRCWGCTVFSCKPSEKYIALLPLPQERSLRDNSSLVTVARDGLVSINVTIVIDIQSL